MYYIGYHVGSVESHSALGGFDSFPTLDRFDTIGLNITLQMLLYRSLYHTITSKDRVPQFPYLTKYQDIDFICKSGKNKCKKADTPRKKAFLT